MLLAINLLLLVALAVVNLSPQPAAAQFGMRGDYVMISGAATGSNDTAAIYLLDLKSQRMAALLFDSRSKKLRTIAGRVVSNDLRARGGR
jgi:hypothetical protein